MCLWLFYLQIEWQLPMVNLVGILLCAVHTCCTKHAFCTVSFSRTGCRKRGRSSRMEIKCFDSRKAAISTSQGLAAKRVVSQGISDLQLSTPTKYIVCWCSLIRTAFFLRSPTFVPSNTCDGLFSSGVIGSSKYACPGTNQPTHHHEGNLNFAESI